MDGYTRIPILEAAALCGLQIKPSTLDNVEAQANCPFCDDRSHHLYLNTEEDLFYCHRCGTGGNSITLYARLCGVDNKTAYRHLCDRVEGTITITRPKTPASKLAPLALRHDVYYDLLELLTLSDYHQKQLLKRGLSLERIAENRYRSMPASYSARRKITAKLAASYPLKGVPGFYLRDGAWTFAGNGGYLIPIYNKDGYIQGMQIRSDRSAGGMKYRWFSSNPEKGFLYGTKAQSWVHVTGDPHSRVACVTEGGLKGDVASYFMGDALFVCVPGVNNLSHLPETLHSLPLKKVVGAYDMDKLQNRQVQDAFAKVESIAKENGLLFEPLEWSPQFKGIDDFLYARHLYSTGRADMIPKTIS